MKKFWMSLGFIMVFIVLMTIIILGLVGGEDTAETNTTIEDEAGPLPFSFIDSPGMFKFIVIMLAVMFAIVILPILMKYPR